ncbi:MAG: hypothetical protein ACOVKS_05510 [Aquimonas sp.]|jgi:hypothetical protein
MRTVHPSPLLRLGLRVDAILSLAAAAVVPLLLEPLGATLGLDRVHMIALAGFMFVWAALTGWMAGQAQLPAWSVWLTVCLNLAWAPASLLLPALGLFNPSSMGWAVLIAQALAVLVFAELQWLGLRRSAGAAAPSVRAAVA